MNPLLPISLIWYRLGIDISTQMNIMLLLSDSKYHLQFENTAFNTHPGQHSTNSDSIEHSIYYIFNNAVI